MLQSVTTTADQGPMAVTYREAGKKLSVCERTVWGLVRDGRLRAVKIGRAVRIPVSELERFIADQTQQG